MSRQKTLNIIGTTLACAIILLSKPLTKKATDGFTIHSIQSVFPSDPQWSNACINTSESFDKILSQKFRYLAKGAQCYVFLSDDDQYVLKFFNQRLYKRKGIEEREKDFLSYKIAYEKFRDETGLLHIHLSPGDGFSKKIILLDRLNIAHEVELGSLEFLLQKRADLAMPAITSAMNEKNEAMARKYLDALFVLTNKRIDEGIIDRDPNMTKNLGFLDGKAIQIDIGRFTLASSPDQFKNDLEYFKAKNGGFSNWLKENYPSLYTYYLGQFSSLELHYQRKIEAI